MSRNKKHKANGAAAEGVRPVWGGASVVFVSADSLRPIPMPKKFKELVLKLESEQ